jgi:hypothetical protein
MIKSCFSIDTIYGEAITKYMKKCKSKPVSSCKEVARTGELAAPQNSSKTNNAGSILLDNFSCDMEILGNQIINCYLPIVYPLGSLLCNPVHLKVNERDYFLVEYCGNFRFIYRIHCDANGYYSAMILDSLGNIGFVPTHCFARLYKRAFETGLVICPNQLIQIIIQNFVYMICDKGTVEKYIMNTLGVIPTCIYGSINIIKPKSLLYVLLTFMPKKFISKTKAQRYRLENKRNRP